MGVRKDSERFSLWSLSLKISYRRNCKLSWIGKPKKKKNLSYLTSEWVALSDLLWEKSKLRVASCMRRLSWGWFLRGMKAQTQPGSLRFPGRERIDPDHPWAAKGYWVSKKKCLTRERRGLKVGVGEELKPYFAYFTILPLFGLRSSNVVSSFFWSCFSKKCLWQLSCLLRLLWTLEVRHRFPRPQCM